MITPRMVRRLAAAIALGLGAIAQARVDAFPPPALSSAVERLLEADYLTESEQLELRIRHGAWTAEDMRGDATTRARIALARGAYDDPSLADEAVPPLVRAEAHAQRGELTKALALLEGQTSMRAVRLRAEALWALGRAAEADAALDAAVAMMGGQSITDARDLVEGTRCLVLRSRLRGPELSDGGDFKAMMALFAKARDELDKLSWEARLGEAALLLEKDNAPEAAAALEEALTLNPRCVEAWQMLGELAAAGFDPERAEAIAARLDVLARGSESDEVKSEDLGSSILGASVVARARLRQNDAAGAIPLLDRLLSKFPEHRELLALRASAAAGAFDFADTDARLAAIDALSPGSPDAWFEVGSQLSNQRQYAEAARYLGEAARRAPKWADPIIELGLLEMQSGRNAQALEALERAATLDTFNVRAANSLTLLRELATFVSHESDHFIVRCKPGVDEIVALEMLPVLERIFTRVTGSEKGGIDHKPAAKTVIELMPNHRWFAVRITGMPGVHTIAAATGPVVAMEAPRSGPGHLIGPYDWPRVVQHEYTHTVTLSRTKNRLPHWFTEAAAVYLEDRPRDYSAIQLLANAYDENALFDLDQINLGFIRPQKPTDRQQAYAQGHWMYEFMIEAFGDRAPLDLMDLYAAGVREEDAFQRVMNVGRDEFLARFKAWAKTQLVAWGMHPKPGQPTIKELIKRDLATDGDADEAVATRSGPNAEAINKWLAEFPDHPGVLRLAVLDRLKASADRVTPELVPLLERYAAARPVDPLPHKLLARYYLASPGQESLAIPHLSFLDAREQNSPSFAMELARQHAAAKEMDKAGDKAERATRIAPYDATVREFAATIALRRGDDATAERHIRALIALEPDREVHKKRLEALLARREKGK